MSRDESKLLHAIEQCNFDRIDDLAESLFDLDGEILQNAFAKWCEAQCDADKQVSRNIVYLVERKIRGGPCSSAHMIFEAVARKTGLGLHTLEERKPWVDFAIRAAATGNGGMRSSLMQISLTLDSVLSSRNDLAWRELLPEIRRELFRCFESEDAMRWFFREVFAGGAPDPSWVQAFADGYRIAGANAFGVAILRVTHNNGELFHYRKSEVLSVKNLIKDMRENAKFIIEGWRQVPAAELDDFAKRGIFLSQSGIDDWEVVYILASEYPQFRGRDWREAS